MNPIQTKDLILRPGIAETEVFSSTAEKILEKIGLE